MKIAKWSDGYVLNSDSRRESSAFFYTKNEAWDSTIIFEVDPFDGFHAYYEASGVILESKNGAREALLEENERLQMYLRVVPALGAHFRSWKRITLRAARLSSFVAELSAILSSHGFKLTSTAQDCIATYERG